MRTRRIGILLCLGALTVSIALQRAEAQTDPAVTFSPELTRASETLTPKFTWTTTTAPAATGCTATGDDPNWLAKNPLAASGNATLPAINASKAYGITCAFPGVSSARLLWTPPTPPTYTSGAPMTIGGYQIYFGKSLSDILGPLGKGPPCPGSTPCPASVTRRPHDFPTATEANVTGIPGSGVYFFCVTVQDNLNPRNESSCAFNAENQLGSKTITGTANVTRSVTLIVDPKPNAVTNFRVE